MNSSKSYDKDGDLDIDFLYKKKKKNYVSDNVLISFHVKIV